MKIIGLINYKLEVRTNFTKLNCGLCKINQNNFYIDCVIYFYKFYKLTE